MRTTCWRDGLLGVLCVFTLLVMVGLCLGSQVADPEVVETTTVQGHVRGPDGFLRGATVAIVPLQRQKDPSSSVSPLAEAVSDEDGHFAVDVSGEGPFAVYATAPGLAPALIDVYDPARTELLLKLVPGLSIEGVVSDEQGGAALAGVTIRVWHKDTQVFRRQDAGDAVARETKTGPDGRYRFGDLRPGDCFLEASAPGWEKRLNEISLSDQGEQPATVHFLLAEGVSLGGRVLDSEGNGIPGATVRVTMDGSRPQLREFERWQRFRKASSTSVSTAEDGRFSFDGLPAMEFFSLGAWHDDYGQRSLDGVKKESHEIEIRLPVGATLRLSLVDAAGVPFTGTLEAVLQHDGKRSARVYDRFHDVTAQADSGVYSLFPASPGPAELTLRPENRTPLQIELEVTEGETLELGERTLPSGITVAGRVVDDRGEGVGDAKVVISYNERERLRVRADDDGRFTAAGFDEGSVTTLAAHADGYGDAELPFNGAGEEPVLILPRGGKLRGRILRADLQDAAHSFVITATRQATPDEDASSRYVMAMTGEGKTRKSFSAVPDGVFELSKLSPGRYSILVEAAGCIAARVESVEIVPGATAELGELTLIPGATIEGYVVNRETGAPVPGASVRRKPAGMDLSMASVLGDDEDPADAVSGAGGEFSIGGLPPGALVFVVEHEGFAKAEFEVELSPGVPPTPVQVELGTGGAIEGVTREPGGAVMPGAMVSAMNGMVPDLKRIVTSDEEGRFRLDTLSPGTYMLVWFKPPEEDVAGAAGAMALPQMRSVIVEDGKTSTLDGEPARKTALSVRGRFLEHDEPLASVQAFWASRNGSGLPITVVSDETGVFEFTLPAPGEFQVSFLTTKEEQPGVGWQAKTIAVTVTRDNALRLEIVIPEGRILGEVTQAETGSAIEGAQVHVFRRDDTDELLGLRSVFSDDEGAFEVDALQEGEYYLLIAARQRTAEIVGPMDLDADDEIDDLSVSLGPAWVREVRVRSESGEPLSGMGVIPMGDGDLGRVWSALAQWSNDDGSTLLSGVPEGVWSVAVLGPGAALTIVDDVAIGPEAVEPLVVTVQRAGVLSIQVTGPDHAPVPDVRLQIREKGGRELTHLLHSFVSTRKRWGMNSDKTGRIVIDALPAGDYRLSVTGPEGRSASASARISAGEESQLEISLH